jgi:hypothetical protein
MTQIFMATGYEMSKSSSPMLLHALHSDINLAISLCAAAAAGLTHLDYCYSMAKANYYNAISSSNRYFALIHTISPPLYIAKINSNRVLHLMFHLGFFKKLDNCNSEYCTISIN